jgi:hypothetical protein
VKFKKPRTRIARIIAAAVCALGIAVPVSATIPAAPAQAATCSQAPWSSGGDLYLPYGPGCSGTLAASHVCVEYPGVGMVNGNAIQPIQCADIAYTNDDFGNGFTDSGELWGEGEFYCQASAGYYQCGGMNVTVGFSSSGTGSYKCNPSPGPACPANGRAMVSSQHAQEYTGAPGVDQCYTVQTTLPAGNVIAILGTAIHTTAALQSPKLKVCFASPGETPS